jgi:hypothetical protein
MVNMKMTRRKRKEKKEKVKEKEETYRSKASDFSHSGFRA